MIHSFRCETYRIFIVLESVAFLPSFVDAQQPMPIVQTYHQWNSEKQIFLPQQQDVTQYDAQARPRMYRSQSWLSTANRWAVTSSLEKDYDQQGNLVQQRSTFWHNKTDTIESVNERLYEYDGLGRLIKTTFNDNAYYQKYFSSSVYTTSYDSRGCVKETLNEYFQNGKSTGISVTEFTTNEMCKPISVRTRFLSAPNQRDQLYVYQYDAEHLINEKEYSASADSILVAEHKYTYNDRGKRTFEEHNKYTRTYYYYDASDNLIRVVNEFWNYTTHIWIPASEIISKYNSNNQLTFQESKYGDGPTLQDWYLRISQTYTYDQSGYKQKVEGRMFNRMVSSETLWEDLYQNRCDGAETELVSNLINSFNNTLKTPRYKKTTIYASDADCESSAEELLHLFPNPATSFTRILLPDGAVISTVNIVSEHGVLVKNYRSDESRVPLELDLSSLLPGMYLVQAYNGEHIISTGRLVKR